MSGHRWLVRVMILLIVARMAMRGGPAEKTIITPLIGVLLVVFGAAYIVGWVLVRAKSVQPNVLWGPGRTGQVFIGLGCVLFGVMELMTLPASGPLWYAAVASFIGGLIATALDRQRSASPAAAATME